MADQQQFFLKWNDFQSNMVSSFKHLRDEKSFTDVTLACEGQTCKAHKMVLSACSPYFKSLLEGSIALESGVLMYQILGQLKNIQLNDADKFVSYKQAQMFQLRNYWTFLRNHWEKANFSGTSDQSAGNKTYPLSSDMKENPSKHPIIILKDVAYSHLQSILEFMYAGEVNVSQEQLPAFLKTADRLKVKGLAEAPQAIKRE